MNGDPQSDYEPIRTHHAGQRDREWIQVRHRELGTLHIYPIRCHKLSPYVAGDPYQVCGTCDLALAEEPPPPPPPPREPEHHCPGCRCWENVR